MRLVEEVRQHLRGSYSPDSIVVVEAPTGYGKSVSVPSLAGELHGRGLSSNFIHVLPLRAIVSDLYERFYLRSFDEPAGSRVLREAREALTGMGLSRDDVAYQMGLDVELGGRKSPAFDARAVVSTLDSFAYNLLRAPLLDAYADVRRYAVVRSRIFSSAIFLDEAHMLLRYPEEEEAGRMLAFLKALIDYSLAARVPLVLMSATLGSWLRERVREWSGGRVTVFSLGKYDRRREGRVEVSDGEFLEAAKQVSWRTELVDEGKVVDRAAELAQSGKRVLIVRDRVSDAVGVYRELTDRGVRAALLHGQLTVGDRERAREEIVSLLERGRGFVAVATPVVEAGVNWDFDAAFRDATNVPSVVQVAGRVCRGRGACEAALYLIRGRASNEGLIGFVEESKRLGEPIDWRVPFDYQASGRRVRGYAQLLELQDLSNLRVDEGAYGYYRILLFSPLPSSSFLSFVERSMDFQLLRRPLVQLHVGEDLSDEPGAFLERLVVCDLGLAERLREHLKGFFCAAAKDDSVVHVLRKGGGRLPLSPGEYVRQVRELLKKLSPSGRAAPLAAGYVVDERAYEQRVGFR